MVGFGIPIKRHGQPHTILIGERRHAVRKPREYACKLWKDKSGEVIKSCEPVLGNNFAIEIIPEGQWIADKEVFRGTFRIRVKYLVDLDPNTHTHIHTHTHDTHNPTPYTLHPTP